MFNPEFAFESRESEGLAKTNVVLLGDSITQGLGTKKINFTESLQQLLSEQYEVHNLAMTGTTIHYPLDLTEGWDATNQDGICVVLYGNVDAQIRPNRNGMVFPHIPQRFKKNGMLMPRPFYSKSLSKQIGQHIDNALRSFFSSLITKLDGTEQWVGLDEFKELYQELVSRLAKRGYKTICCSTVYIDENLFPGSLQQYELFNEAIASIANESGLLYIDLFSSLKKEVEAFGWDYCYNKDHFHPNATGYQIIADLLSLAIRAR